MVVYPRTQDRTPSHDQVSHTLRRSNRRLCQPGDQSPRSVPRGTRRTDLYLRHHLRGVLICRHRIWRRSIPDTQICEKSKTHNFHRGFSLAQRPGRRNNSIEGFDLVRKGFTTAGGASCVPAPSDLKYGLSGWSSGCPVTRGRRSSGKARAGFTTPGSGVFKRRSSAALARKPASILTIAESGSRREWLIPLRVLPVRRSRIDSKPGVRRNRRRRWRRFTTRDEGDFSPEVGEAERLLADCFLASIGDRNCRCTIVLRSA